jgi:DNA-binding XRE family transcriptional regulator
MKNWKKLKQELLTNATTKQEYQKLEPEYKLAQELLKARLNKNLTQTEVARKAGISQVMIARLESGSSNPTLETISRVANVLGKEVKLVGSHR